MTRYYFNIVIGCIILPVFWGPNSERIDAVLSDKRSHPNILYIYSKLVLKCTDTSSDRQQRACRVPDSDSVIRVSKRT